jgi:hypothetical protein
MKLSLLAIFFLLNLTAISQTPNPTERYRITQFKENGKNVTKEYKGREQYLLFFENEKNESCFALGSEITKEKSYGMIYLTDSKKNIQTKDNCSAETINFRWKYHNSYDSVCGYATNTFTKIFTEPIVSFHCVMATQDLVVYEYSGYMEKPSEYFNETELVKR